MFTYVRHQARYIIQFNSLPLKIALSFYRCAEAGCILWQLQFQSSKHYIKLSLIEMFCLLWTIRTSYIHYLIQKHFILEWPSHSMFYFFLTDITSSGFYHYTAISNYLLSLWKLCGPVSLKSIWHYCDLLF